MLCVARLELGFTDGSNVLLLLLFWLVAELVADTAAGAVNNIVVRFGVFFVSRYICQCLSLCRWGWG